MTIYDEIEIEDMVYDEDMQIFTYPCPCGDRFEVLIDDLYDGSTEIAVCPSCSLQIQVIFQKSDLLKFKKDLDPNEQETSPDLICA